MTNALLISLVGPRVRQESSGLHIRGLFDVSSLNLSGGCLTISPTGPFHHRVSVPFLHVLEDCTTLCSMVNKMTISSKIFERFRSRLIKLVAKERKETGCQAIATKRVASKIGVSSMWVRRVLGNYGGAKIQADHYVAVLMLTFGGAAKRVATKFRKSALSHRAGLNA